MVGKGEREWRDLRKGGKRVRTSCNASRGSFPLVRRVWEQTHEVESLIYMKPDSSSILRAKGRTKVKSEKGKGRVERKAKRNLPSDPLRLLLPRLQL